MHSVLFICTANICRSPMAMGLLMNMTKSEKNKWKIDSAGVMANPGKPASDLAQKVLQKKGIMIEDHRSQMVTLELLESFHLVLTMERMHKEMIRIAFPHSASRLYLISEMVGKKYDIIDPFGLQLSDYEETAEQIENIIKNGFDMIKQLSKGVSSDNE
jgi:protein arginine phosphatase